MANSRNSLIVIEGPENSFHDDEHSFYKIVLPGTSTNGPAIPPSFLEHIDDKVDLNVVTLSNSSGSKWFVQLRHEGSSLIFQDGWEEFYRDNSLKISDLLLFLYDGELEFRVSVYDKNGSKIA
ncbi:transcriptional factor B3 family protein [Striga asiatica]|uniref:Transcriptional factor B3 family protein n=1 Tax=Striga asiatica TaxID=4170 RepID=A0A5A7PYJ3_STRAF|nr:transcriptional factor B3 family protein [Striga asiatica]